MHAVSSTALNLDLRQMLPIRYYYASFFFILAYTAYKGTVHNDTVRTIYTYVRLSSLLSGYNARLKLSHVFVFGWTKLLVSLEDNDIKFLV